MVNLLPYHNIATGKYQKLEIEYNADEMDEPSEEEIQKATEIFNSFNLEVEVGG
jgi:pyruvate formate lyase activating enzyme